MIKRFNEMINESRYENTLKEISSIFQELMDNFEIKDVFKKYHNLDTDGWYGYMTKGRNQVVYSISLSLNVSDIESGYEFYKTLSHIAKINELELSTSSMLQKDYNSESELSTLSYTIHFYTKTIIESDRNHDSIDDREEPNED